MTIGTDRSFAMALTSMDTWVKSAVQSLAFARSPHELEVVHQHDPGLPADPRLDEIPYIPFGLISWSAISCRQSAIQVCRRRAACRFAFSSSLASPSAMLRAFMTARFSRRSRANSASSASVYALRLLFCKVVFVSPPGLPFKAPVRPVEGPNCPATGLFIKARNSRLWVIVAAPT